MVIIPENTIAFTGYRHFTAHPQLSRSEVEGAMRDTLYELLEREHLESGVDTFLCGMAVGFDMLAAKVVLALRLRYPALRLVAVVPFEGQEVAFSEQEQETYRHILAAVDHTFIIEPQGYTPQSYHQRNNFLVEFSSKIVAYHNGNPRSGTSSTLRKAANKKRAVANIYNCPII